MADLRQRILLEGIDQIKAGFAAIANAGEQAFAAINRLKFSPEHFNALSTAATRINRSFRELGSASEDFGKKFRNSEKTAALLATTVLGLAVAFGKLVTSATDAADSLDEASQAAGLSSKEFELLRGAIKQSGIDADGFGSIVDRFNKSADTARTTSGEFEKKQRDLIRQFNAGTLSALDYANEMKELNDAVKKSSDGYVRLGINVLGTDGKARKLTDVLDDVAEKFQDMPDGVEKSAIAIELFGRSGTRMIPFLNQGKEGIAKLTAQTERLSPTLTTAQKQIGSNFNDALDRLSLAASNTKNQFFLLFAPALQRLVDGLTEAIVQNRDAILDLGRTILNNARPALVDFLALIRGDQPTKGGFVDRVVQGLKAVGEAIGIVVAAFNGLVAAADLVAEAINSIFGTEFTGKGLVIAALIVQLVGGFGLMASAVTLVSAAVTALATAIGFIVTLFGPWGVAIAAVAVAIGALWVKLGGIDGVKVLLQDFLDWFTNTWVGQILVWVGKLIIKLGELAAAFAKALFKGGGDGKVSVGGSGTPTGFAEGGKIRGPGSGTSDSILARLSDGEYVVKAAAVRHFGSGLFDALNNLRVPGFASGGMVAAVPSGGGSSRTLNLSIDGQSFQGLRVPEKTAKDLERFALNRRLASAGRAPAWQK